MEINKQILKQYVYPYVWQGFSWIDGGLGIQEPGEGMGWRIVDGKKVEDLRGVKKAPIRAVTRLLKPQTESRVFVSPDSDMYMSKDGTDQYTSNARYICCFAGRDILHLDSLIREISAVCDSQVWTLDAYTPEDGQAVKSRYRLWIRQGTFGEEKFDEPRYKILEGTMVPDFSRSQDIAGW